jgi:hypothetical protein
MKKLIALTSLFFVTTANGSQTSQFGMTEFRTAVNNAMYCIGHYKANEAGYLAIGYAQKDYDINKKNIASWGNHALQKFPALQSTGIKSYKNGNVKQDIVDFEVSNWCIEVFEEQLKVEVKQAKQEKYQNQYMQCGSERVQFEQAAFIYKKVVESNSHTSLIQQEKRNQQIALDALRSCQADSKSIFGQ